MFRFEVLPAGQSVGAGSRVYRFGELAVTHGSNGGEGRDVLHGAIVTGEQVALHESVQPAGAKPNPAHTIAHTEFILMREGTLEVMHDGVTERAGPGDVILIARGTLHGVRNLGDGPASYFVMSVGGDTNR